MTLKDSPGILGPSTSVAPTCADAVAQSNRAANLRALAQTQPSLTIAIALRSPDLRWMFGRDGFLTAQTPAGQWLADCSLPHRAAQALLGKPVVTGTTACFLSPSHAAQLRVNLDAIRDDQAIIAIVPELETLAQILHCDDFAADIAARRLWFAAGSDWTDELRNLLIENPGLPSPLQFLRTSLLHGDVVNTLIPRAERIFAAVAEHRATDVERLRRQQTSPAAAPRLCILGSPRFRLWDDASRILLDLASQTGMPAECVNPDRPDQASHLALALAASECDLLLTANAARADLPRVLRPDLPVITWITAPRIPAPDAQSPGDVLILADEAWLAPARAAGWTPERLSVGSWPACPQLRPHETPAHLAIIADTLDPSPDRQRFDLSSHRLLWEMILEELRKNPFALSADLGGYLRRRMDHVGIQSNGFDARRFVEELILPAYQQGVAAALLHAGLPLRLHGRGWAEIAEFRPHVVGAITSSEQLATAAQAAAALVHVWPAAGAHPIDALRQPVLRASDTRQLIAAAHRLLTSPTDATHPAPELSPATIRNIIVRIR